MAVPDSLVGSGELPGIEQESSALLFDPKSERRGRLLQRPLKTPDPPFREEFYQYFDKTRHRRLVLFLQIAGFGSLYGIWAVFSKSWDWFPLMLILVVLVPWKIFGTTLIAKRSNVTLQSHSAVIAHGWRNRTHSVDVFLPICGESSEIIYNTFTHVSKLIWDGPLRVYVLDDGADPFAKALARELAFTYVLRPNRGEHRKSGNMNYGLSVSDGDYIAAFDADFAPGPNFLLETVPYFVDSGTGIVQTAQYFSTDRRSTRNWLQQYAGVVQSTFYTWAQPGRQATGTAFCVGTNVLYRRAALLRADGFPQVPVGEDIVTTLDLLHVGFRTVYVPLTMARGVCPDSFAAAVNQQYRWCCSAFNQIAPRTVYNQVPLKYRKAPLDLKQRICFASAIFYYLQSILELVATATPSLVMMWCYPAQVQPGNYLPIAPAMIGMLGMPYVVRGWRPALLRLQIVYSASHLLAMIDSFRGRTAAWVPTGQQQRRRSKRARVPTTAGMIVRSWVITTQALAWIALSRDLSVYSLYSYWVALLLTSVQTLVLFPLLLPGYGTRGTIRQLITIMTPRRWRYVSYRYV